MNNLLSYCGLVDVRISASEKDLLVPRKKMMQTLTDQTQLENDQDTKLCDNCEVDYKEEDVNRGQKLNKQ